MKTLKIKLTILALLAFIASHAQNATPAPNDKPVQQNKEIQNGKTAGEINRREARRQKAKETAT